MFIQLLCFTQRAFGTLQGLIKVWHLGADAAETHHHVSLPCDADTPEFAAPQTEVFTDGVAARQVTAEL